MQKVAHELHLQEKLTVYLGKLTSEASDDLEMVDSDKDKDSLFCEDVKEAIMACFAAILEKYEDARTDFVMNREALLGLVEIVGKEPKLTRL